MTNLMNNTNTAARNNTLARQTTRANRAYNAKVMARQHRRHPDALPSNLTPAEEILFEYRKEQEQQ